VVAAPSGPSASELAARRRAAVARRRAQALRVARLTAQRQQATRLAVRRQAARLAAQKRAGQARATAGAEARHSAAFSEPKSPLTIALLAVGLFGAALCLGAALTPARAVPWERAARTLDYRRQELALVGVFSVGATSVFLLFALMSA